MGTTTRGKYCKFTPASCKCIVHIFPMLNHEFDRLGFVALYLVMTLNWFPLSLFGSDFESHIFIYKEWFPDVLGLFPQKAGFAPQFMQKFCPCVCQYTSMYSVVEFFGFLWGVKKLWCRLCLLNNDNPCKQTLGHSFCTVIVTQVDGLQNGEDHVSMLHAWKHLYVM